MYKLSLFLSIPNRCCVSAGIIRGCYTSRATRQGSCESGSHVFLWQLLLDFARVHCSHKKRKALSLAQFCFCLYYLIE